MRLGAGRRGIALDNGGTPIFRSAPVLPMLAGKSMALPPPAAATPILVLPILVLDAALPVPETHAVPRGAPLRG